MATNQLRLVIEDGAVFEVEHMYIAVDNADSPWFMSDDPAVIDRFISVWNTFIKEPTYDNYAEIMLLKRSNLL